MEQSRNKIHILVDTSRNKIHILVDTLGHPLKLVTAAGHVADATQAPALLTGSSAAVMPSSIKRADSVLGLLGLLGLLGQ